MVAIRSGSDKARTPRTGGDLAGAGSLLALIVAGQARSRAELIAWSGLSRATVSQRLGALREAGLVDEPAETMRSGGRPTQLLRLNTGFNVVLVADIGESVGRVAVTDLGPTILAEATFTVDLTQGPIPVLTRIAAEFAALLGSVARVAGDVLGVGLCLPAPVDYAAGRVFGPSVMTGWDDFDIRGFLGGLIDAPVFVENDVNLMTLSEWRRFWPDVGQLLFIKAGTGIGSGIIADGRIYRGAQGAAGDIGHIQLGGPDGPVCRCGKLGCVEARAAGWALARDLRARGVDAENARDVVTLLMAGQADAIALVHAAGRVLGEVTADVVSVLNPSVIVLGGTLSGAGHDLLAGLKVVVMERSLPLATRDLQVVQARSNDSAGLLGAAQLTINARLSSNQVEATLSRFMRHRARSGAAREQTAACGDGPKVR